jgi:hypothetical protein
MLYDPSSFVETDRHDGTDATDAFETSAGDANPDSPPQDGGADRDATREPIALDTFSRTMDGGLGTAEIGGKWTTASNKTTVGVGNGGASITMTAGASSFNGTLAEVSSTDVDITVSMATEKLGSGNNGLYLRVVTRTTSTAHYGFMTLVKMDGSLYQTLYKNVSGTDTTIVSLGPNVKVAPNERLRLRAQATGTNPTTLRAKFWKDVEAEPERWQLETSDSAPELQGAGAVGFDIYLSTGATNVPFSVDVDDFAARPSL